MSDEKETLQSFLGHQSRTKFTSNYLRGWRKKGRCRVALLKRAPIVPVWQHSIPRLQIREVDGVRTTEVWSGSWNCVEPEAVLRKQYMRDRESDERKTPPTICPL